MTTTLQSSTRAPIRGSDHVARSTVRPRVRLLAALTTAAATVALAVGAPVGSRRVGSRRVG